MDPCFLWSKKNEYKLVLGTSFRAKKICDLEKHVVLIYYHLNRLGGKNLLKSKSENCFRALGVTLLLFSSVHITFSDWHIFIHL